MRQQSKKPAAQPPGLSSQATGYFLLLTLSLVYPALSMLWRHEYPVLDPGALLLLGGLAMLAGVLALVLVRISAPVRHLLLAVSLFMACLVQFDPLFEGALLALALCALLAWVASRRVWLLLPVIGAVILGAYLDAGPNRNSGAEIATITPDNNPAPPLIHLVMDSFIGPNGLPKNAQGSQLRSDILRAFGERGFEIFPHAYSRYSATVDSLHSAFNFKTGSSSKFTLGEVAREGHNFDENRYFDILEDSGYRLNIYQNAEMDFCAGNTRNTGRCWVYELPHLRSVHKGVERPTDRARELFRNLVRQSVLLRTVLVKYGWFGSRGISVYEPQIFDELLADILDHPDGNAFFAHVLFPHGPFTYDQTCLLDYATPLLERYPITDQELDVSSALREARYRRYMNQANCAVLELEGFLDHLQQSGILDRAIVIIHGDHGSSVSRYPIRSRYRQALTIEDYRATFSTLFTIRLPGGEFRNHPQVLPLEILMDMSTEAIREVRSGSTGDSNHLDPAPFEPAQTEEFIYVLGTLPLQRRDVKLFSD